MAMLLLKYLMRLFYGHQLYVAIRLDIRKINDSIHIDDRSPKRKVALFVDLMKVLSRNLVGVKTCGWGQLLCEV